ncbi:MAG TPA: SPOR domain-containing protein [Candidatus Polarisedimenticolia bacterium]|nr:SPOR domain-containing protein [Candidatus Polarisedimenticolia bacterium]
MPRPMEEGGREFQLETRHLAFLIALVVVLCVASFMVGRWVERQSLGPTVSSAVSRSADPNVEEGGDVAEDLTFFDSLKEDRPVPLQASGETAPARPAASSPRPPSRTAAETGRRSVNEGVMIQVFASRDRAAADAIRNRLRSRGYTALMVSEGGSYKVRVGPYADKEEAERSAAVLRQQENLSTWIP